MVHYQTAILKIFLIRFAVIAVQNLKFNVLFLAVNCLLRHLTDQNLAHG